MTLSRRDLWLTPIAIFAVTRAALMALMSIAPRILPGPKISANTSLLPPTDLLWSAANWTRPWFRFDAGWYVGIAEHGYHWGPLGQANTNFMPVYPALIRLIQPLTAGSAWLAAWLVANVALCCALVVLWRWALGRYSHDVAGRVVLLVACFPFGFFLSAPYAEPVFLALAVGAFLLAEEGRWPAAVCCAAFCTITRPVGVAVVFGLVALALGRGDVKRALSGVLALLPLAAFSGYLWLAFGHPLAFLTYHSGGWIAPHGGFWNSIGSQFHTQLSPFDRIDALLSLLFLASAVAVWRRLGPGYAVYLLLGVLMPLAHGLASMERYVVVLFPAIAMWAAIENRVIQAGLFAVSVAGIIVATSMFGAGFTLA